MNAPATNPITATASGFSNFMHAPFTGSAIDATMSPAPGRHRFSRSLRRSQPHMRPVYAEVGIPGETGDTPILRTTAAKAVRDPDGYLLICTPPHPVHGLFHIFPPVPSTV